MVYSATCSAGLPSQVPLPISFLVDLLDVLSHGANVEISRTSPWGYSRVKAFSHAEIKVWAERSLVPETTVVSNGLWCFKSVTQAGFAQQREVVGSGRKSTDMECFSWVNTILGNLKNAINGTYHAFDFEKYAHRYLGEFQYRFNRRFDLANLLPRMIVAAVNTGKRPERWLRLAEDQC